ncbi:LOG family protein [Paucibacter sp. JuS9]|uniref:LOG family protein n=1 Tax=Paucibacter sp. JuS9 TaxID=3228748 RepID=UPI003756CE77
MPVLAIFGTWRAPEEGELYRFALDCAAAAARVGWSVATGGYSGVMDAGLRGATEGGTAAIAHVWNGFDGELPVSAHASSVHRHTRIADRVAALVGQAEACLVLPGRLGTVAELALALECRAKGQLQLPVMLHGSYWEPFLAWLRASNAGLNLPADDVAPPLHARVDDAHEVETLLRSLAR